MNKEKLYRFVKASERPLPELKDRERLNIRYNCKPDLLTYYDGLWYWGDSTDDTDNILNESSFTAAIEWLEEVEMPNY